MHALAPYCLNQTSPESCSSAVFFDRVVDKFPTSQHSYTATACFRAERLGDRSIVPLTNRSGCSVSASAKGGLPVFSNRQIRNSIVLTREADFRCVERQEVDEKSFSVAIRKTITFEVRAMDGTSMFFSPDHDYY